MCPPGKDTVDDDVFDTGFEIAARCSRIAEHSGNRGLKFCIPTRKSTDGAERKILSIPRLGGDV